MFQGEHHPRHEPAATQPGPSRRYFFRASARRRGSPIAARCGRRSTATRRAIFLDIDGVLAPIRSWDRYGDLDPACIQVLNEIVARGQADVIVSSTWRYGKTVAELQEMLEAQGFTGSVVDTTRTGTPGADRGEEIAAWLAEHAVEGYVIIDDHVDMGELRSHLVQTQPAIDCNQPTHRE